MRAWYLDRLRPKLAEAEKAGIVGRGAVEEFDLQVAELFDLFERHRVSNAASA